ncbi:MAG: hypothetical protein JW870_20300 [Candidatus Delongbacteria bacterium]|nr:hypothetical protein [Candidatus Delongbacteria bacterium]
MNNFEMADKTRGVTAFLFLLVGLLFGSPLIGSWARDENNIVGRIFRIFFNIVLPAGALFLIIGTLFRLNFDFDNIINIVSETITRYF